MGHRTEIMWIEHKSDGLTGSARIGRVTYSKSGRSITYRGKTFHSLGGTGFKTNFVDAESGDEYWISGCHRDGKDALYSTTVEIDDDVRQEYWTVIRRLPKNKDITSLKVAGKYRK